MKKVGVIDYGMGNLHSVIGALKLIGCDSVISSDLTVLESADALILPGVGAFPDAMDCLNRLHLTEFIRMEALKKPLLGICLGMQLLFDRSYEFRKCEGLGLIPGEVIKLTAYENDRKLKIPHMGWNSLDIKIETPLTENLPETAYVYFVHSFKGVPINADNLAASTDYGEDIAAIVHSGNTYGCQFHPEKSESVGLQMLRNFTTLF
jgi:glutamine amidotransferase